jgi:two-component system sensor histidine kinase UhpB
VQLDTGRLETPPLLVAVFERAPHGIALTDLSGRYVRANPAFLRLLGYSEPELLQKTIHDVTHSEDKGENRRVFDDMVAGVRDQIEFEKRYLRKDGRVIWVRNTVAKVPGEDGEPRYVVAMVEDITARRHAEAQLRDSEQLVRAIFERSPVGISIADTRLRYLDSNASFQRMLGYSGAELKAKSVRDVTHPEDYPGNARLCEELLAGAREQFSLEKRFVAKNGALTWGRITVMLIRGSDGAPHHFTSLVEDITDRRRSEARELQEERALLEATRKLQALTRRLVEAEELQRRRIAGELHDRVGQSLSALNINLDIALGMLAGAQPELKLRLADSLSLVDGTLQTIENLMAELRPPLLDEYGLAAALGLHVKEFSKRHGVRVEVRDLEEVGRGLRPEVAIALFRIAQEALVNVAKHAEAGHVRIVLAKQDNGAVLSITDDGRGFDVKERLAHRTRWGVTTMQERAAALGGQLYLESAPGTGTTVRVTVRDAEAAQGDA